MTPAQAIIRWHLQIGNIVIPKSVTPARIEQNLASANVELTDAQVQAINGVDAGNRQGGHPDTADF